MIYDRGFTGQYRLPENRMDEFLTRDLIIYWMGSDLSIFVAEGFLED